MKILGSVLFRIECKSVSSHLKNRFVCLKDFKKYASSNTNVPRNMFELYAKNSHWLGVYSRHPLKKDELTYQEIEEIKQKEKEKNQLLDLESSIDYKNAIWTPESMRTGAIGVKLGCTGLWTKRGHRFVATLIQIKDCHVIDTQISREDGGKDKMTQVIVGTHDITDDKHLSMMSREKLQWYDEKGFFPKQFWSGFPVTKNALLLPGTEITASHFQPGQYVRVYGITIKQGFQGVMKRWGMKGQPASHGQTKTHRKMGATGGGQDPGRIFPGKKMAGHVGGKMRKTKSLEVFRIDRKLNVLFVKGYIPGEIGGFVKVRDTTHRKFPIEPPPFPTSFPEDVVDLEEDAYSDTMFRFTDPSLEFPPYKL